MSKTELFSRKTVGGVFSIYDESKTTGTIFWVDSTTGTDAASNGLQPDNPLATIDYAVGLCTADKYDRILVMPGHTETRTTAITCDVAGVKIIGMGEGNLRPTISGNAAADVVTVTADDVSISGLIFPAPSTDAQTACINIAAAGVHVYGCEFHGSKATNLNCVGIITLTAAAHDALIEDCFIYNDNTECVGGIVIEGVAERVTIRNVIVQDSVGFTNGCINDAATALQLTLDSCVFTNAKAATVVAEFGNNTTGIARNCFFNGRHTTIQSNLTPGTGMNFCQCFGVEEAAKNGLLMPAVDAE